MPSFVMENSCVESTEESEGGTVVISERSGDDNSIVSDSYDLWSDGSLIDDLSGLFYMVSLLCLICSQSHYISQHIVLQHTLYDI